MQLPFTHDRFLDVFGSYNRALWPVQAVFFAWKGVVRSKLVFRAPHPRWAPLAAVLVAYALVYPGLGLLLGLEYPRMPLFGVPCPTAILTCGALMLVPQREARPASIIPILWSAVGGSAAFLLDVTADLALLFSGVALFVYVTSLARKHEEETD